MNALRRMLARRRASTVPRIPDGYRVYAIGDIHGRDDLLATLLEKIERDSVARGDARTVIVFLGDFIDRGPASNEAVERLCTLQVDARLVFLAGNHEEVLLRILDGEARLIPDWLKFGGAECLGSYGVDPAQFRTMAPRAAVALLREKIPGTHVQFLRSLEDTFSAGDYLFVHAGIRPGLALEDQARSDLRWIREPFLSDATEHGFVVVHGHTIREQVEEQPNRIGIDTGAYRSGVLTALALEGSERWLIQSTPDDAAWSDSLRNRKDFSALDTVSGQSG